MSNKTNSPGGRRTPMSLSGSVTKTAGNSHKSGHAVHTNNTTGSGNVNGVSGPNANSKSDNKNQQTKANAAVIDLTKESQSNNTKKSTNTTENKKEKEKTQNGISSNKGANPEKQVVKDMQTTLQPEKLTINTVVNKEQKENINKTEKVVVGEKTETAPEIKGGNKNNEKGENLKTTEKPTKSNIESKADMKAKSIEEGIVVGDVKNNEIEVNNSKKPVEVDTVNKEVTSEIVIEHGRERTPSTPTTKKTHSSSGLRSVENSPSKPFTSNLAIKPLVTVNVENCQAMVVVENNLTNASPKKEEKQLMQPPTLLPPATTSTPGKFLLQKRNIAANLTEVQLLPSQKSYSPERPRKVTKITGRRSIHSVKEYTPSKTHNESQYTQSYRRINTEFDDTNASLNVTVGSTVLDDSLSSFYMTGRKRERTLNAEDEPANVMASPPKKARLDIFGLFYSPITMLRNRLSKTSLKSSTPVNLEEQFEMLGKNDVEVQNVSGISVEENDEVSSVDDKENIASDFQAELDEDNLKVGIDEKMVESDEGKLTHDLDIEIDDEMPIEIKEISAKQRKCVVM